MRGGHVGKVNISGMLLRRGSRRIACDGGHRHTVVLAKLAHQPLAASNQLLRGRKAGSYSQGLHALGSMTDPDVNGLLLRSWRRSGSRFAALGCELLRRTSLAVGTRGE
jgi:hypothetical protein